MKGNNLLIIMVDEMAAQAVGCYGHPTVKTPNIDRIAARGVRFTKAYTNSPICVPARAVFATGRYPHQTGYWDNVFAYDGAVRGWGHRLQEAGHKFTTIGKLHYLDENSDTGINEQILPMHIYGGGDVFGLERETPPKRPQSAAIANEIAIGDSEYTRYDKEITKLTEDWFRTRMEDQGDKPWVCFSSFIAPHFPLTVPKEYIDLYDPRDIVLPDKPLNRKPSLASWWDLLTFGYNFDSFFKNDEHRRQAILHYYALCSFADQSVGRVLEALDASGQAEDTIVIFLSDHGDNMGARGLWGKSNMYEESACIPLIISGPGLAEGKVCETPVSLVDIYQTVLDVVGVESTEEDRTLPGNSLIEIARQSSDAKRQVFSEYHASCAPTGLMMLRNGRFKYIHYTGYGAELYDLENDPDECRDIADDPAFVKILEGFERDLREIMDPEDTDRRAKFDQRERLAAMGGMKKIIAQGGITHTPPPGEEGKRINQ